LWGLVFQLARLRRGEAPSSHIAIWAGYDPGMPNTPPDRAKDSRRQPPQPLNMVRGGAICDPQQKGAHLMKGSGQAAICMPTPGIDQRPRWRQAGKLGGKSRHSLHFKQHR
jgi:hypothetical protein